MNDQFRALHAYITAWRVSLAHRMTDDRGEGVISAAIAVLIIAFIGVAAYTLFSQLVEQAGAQASTQVDQIGG